MSMTTLCSDVVHPSPARQDPQHHGLQQADVHGPAGPEEAEVEAGG